MLKDKIVIVTGGAMGNGLGIVKKFLENGAKVMVMDYSDSLREVMNNLSNYKSQIAAFKVDIRDEVNVKKCIDYIISKYKRIDGLVNNAGICELDLFLDMSTERRDKHFDINIKGTWNVTKEVLKHMKSTGGSIVNLSSVTGPMVADSGEVAYATTKAAIIGFTKSLAIEHVSDNVRVNAILPGYILTPLVENMAMTSNPDNPNSVIEGIAKGIPMKRLGTISEIGDLALFLISDMSTYITGQGIVIDGGSTLPETNSMGV